MKEVKGNTKQKSGSKLKQLWKDNGKSQHKDAHQDRMTPTEWKTRKCMSKCEKLTEIKETKEKNIGKYNHRELKERFRKKICNTNDLRNDTKLLKSAISKPYTSNES